MTTSPPRSPVPQGVSAELRRLTDRWHQLPLEAAVERQPLVRALLADLAARTAPGAGPVPDLGPAAVPDQLAVLLYDACAAGVPGLEERLTQHRRSL